MTTVNGLIASLNGQPVTGRHCKRWAHMLEITSSVISPWITRYKSYWDLHLRAIKGTRQRSEKTRKSNIDANQLVHLQGQIPDQGVMVISDFHAGKRYGNQTHREQKRAAIKAMLSMAIRNKTGGRFRW